MSNESRAQGLTCQTALQPKCLMAVLGGWPSCAPRKRSSKRAETNAIEASHTWLNSTNTPKTILVCPRYPGFQGLSVRGHDEHTKNSKDTQKATKLDLNNEHHCSHLALENSIGRRQLRIDGQRGRVRRQPARQGRRGRGRGVPVDGVAVAQALQELHLAAIHWQSWWAGSRQVQRLIPGMPPSSGRGNKGRPLLRLMFEESSPRAHFIWVESMDRERVC